MTNLIKSRATSRNRIALITHHTNPGSIRAMHVRMYVASRLGMCGDDTECRSFDVVVRAGLGYRSVSERHRLNSKRYLVVGLEVQEC